MKKEVKLHWENTCQIKKKKKSAYVKYAPLLFWKGEVFALILIVKGADASDLHSELSGGSVDGSGAKTSRRFLFPVRGLCSHSHLSVLGCFPFM